MQCQHCGKSIKDGSIFCPSCGIKIEKESVVIDKTEEKTIIESEKQTEGFDSNYSDNPVVAPIDSEASVSDTIENKNNKNKHKKPKNTKKRKVLLFLGLSLTALCAIAAGVLFLIQKINTTPVGTSGLNNIEIGQEYDDAVSFFENGNYEKAIDLLNTIPKEYIWYSKIQTTKQEIVEAYINNICTKINSCLESEKHDEALLIINEASDTIISFDVYDQKYYNDIITQYLDNVYSEVDSLIKSERFVDAIECLESISLTIKDSSSYDEKRESVITTFKQDCLSKAESYVKQGKYDEAISALQSFADFVKNDKEVTGKINEITNTRTNVEKEQILNEIEKYESDGDYEGGIKYINNQIGLYKTDSDISKKLNNLKDKYRSKILADAEEAFNSSGYLSAIDVLNASQGILPNDATITQKINEYKTYAPVSIKTFKVTASNGYSFSGSASDPRGEVAVDVIELEYYIEFYLAGGYSQFTAKIDPTQYFNTSSYQGVQLRILADDVEVYKSPTITYKTDNLDVSVNIKNADYLAFKLTYVGGSNYSEYWSADPILIYDAFVTK